MHTRPARAESGGGPPILTSENNMTHSLHRSGSIKSMRGDYVWLMYQAKGINDKNIAGKALEFIAVAEAVGSENWGDVKSGPTVSFTPSEIKKRVTDAVPPARLLHQPGTGDRVPQADQGADLGLSVIISGLLDEVLPGLQGGRRHPAHHQLRGRRLGTKGPAARRRDPGRHHHVRAPHGAARPGGDAARRGPRRTPQARGRRQGAGHLLPLRHLQPCPRRQDPEGRGLGRREPASVDGRRIDPNANEPGTGPDPRDLLGIPD